MTVNLPQQDTTRFLDDFRVGQISHLLTAAVCEFHIGTVLDEQPLSFDAICEKTGLNVRPASVLLTALRSIDLIDLNERAEIELTAYGREKLSPSSPFHLRGYIGLGAFSADVQNMIACLKNDAPSGDVSFVYHDSSDNSALDDPQFADVLARAMSDRAKNVAPLLAQKLDLSNSKHLVDVGGGHGLYSFYPMLEHRQLRATIVDREPALRVAREFAEALDLLDRTEFAFGDIHQFVVPDQTDTVLMANILHDYNSTDASQLVKRFGQMLPTGGRLMVLDSLLQSVEPGEPPVSKGPREVAAYSGLLFSICEGRCYRLDEVESWLSAAGLTVQPNIVSLPAHGSVVIGIKSPSSPS